MPLLFSLKQSHSIPLEVDAVRLDVVRTLPVDSVRRLPVQYGNKQLTVDDFFIVSGSAADDNEMVWEGDCRKVKLIAAGLTAGRVRVRGNAGMHLGAEMTGGEVICEGDASDWVGAEMHGGRIVVHGNAGHLVGSVYRGGRKGMTGGEILIHGNAGNEIGHSMRRGLIAVAGTAGDAAGFNMLAGSIFLFGDVGIRHGAGMRRGTIAFFSAAPPLLPTFRVSAAYEPVFLRIYLRHLQQHGFPVSTALPGSQYQRYNGDFLELGRGEILIRRA